MKQAWWSRASIAICLALSIALGAYATSIAQPGEEDECEEAQLVEGEILLQKANEHWLGGRFERAVGEAYQAHLLCPSYIAFALNYVGYLEKLGDVNEAVNVLRMAIEGYPREDRCQGGLRLEAIQARHAGMSVVVVSKAGYLEPLDVSVAIEGSGLTPREERLVEEVEANLYETPGTWDQDRVRYLPPGRYRITVFLEDPSFPSPRSLEQDEEGRRILYRENHDFSPGEVARLKVAYERGGDFNRLYMVAISALAVFMFR